MKKSLIMAILFSGLASAPVAAAPYVSLSGGIGLPGEWKETNYSTDKLNSGIVLSGAVGYSGRNTRFEGALGYQQHNWTIPTNNDSVSFLTMMANGYYGRNGESGFSPYVMAGAGFTRANASWSIRSNTNFVWQVGAGFGVKLDEKFTIDVGYRYFKPEGLECPEEGNSVNWNSHNILAGIRYML
ncbi:MAG: outer membrane beta-barrel protein [Chlorobiaceae bacterium]